MPFEVQLKNINKNFETFKASVPVFLAIIILILRNLFEHYSRDVVKEEVSAKDKSDAPNLKAGGINAV